ncbi:hypothetical protein BSLG_005963 [Batrachochytrium salamandrivorans]|nr:hypothetical protein BSLG_005963 [Batrachochytrium salamandrivorans]
MSKDLPCELKLRKAASIVEGNESMDSYTANGNPAVMPSIQLDGPGSNRLHIFHDPQQQPDKTLLPNLTDIKMSELERLGQLLALAAGAIRLSVQSIAVNFHHVAYSDRVAQLKRYIRVLDKLRKSIKGIGLTDIFDLDKIAGTGQSHIVSVSSGNQFNQMFVKEDFDEINMLPLQNLQYVEKHNARTHHGNQVTHLHQRLTDGGSPSQRNVGSFDRKMLGSMPNSRFTTLTSTAKRRGRTDLPESEPSQGGTLPSQAVNNPDCKTALTVDCFRPYFSSDTAAREAFDLFDADFNKSLSLKEMKQAILRVYRERRNLFGSLHDLSQALGRLNQIFCFVSKMIHNIRRSGDQSEMIELSLALIHLKTFYESACTHDPVCKIRITRISSFMRYVYSRFRKTRIDSGVVSISSTAEIARPNQKMVTTQRIHVYSKTSSERP